MKIAVVLNPAARAGRIGLEWPFFEQALKKRFGAFEVERTGRPGEAGKIARAFAEKGADIVIAGGGDGTVSEVADGLLNFAAQAGAAPALSVAPVGTGSDFARSLGIPRLAQECVRLIAERPPRRIDAGRVTFIDDAGRPSARHFVSVASLGVSGAVVRAVNALPAARRARVSGKALFFLHTLREFMRYDFQEVRIEVDGQPALEARILLAAVANNPYFGGGMMVAPDARPDDGRFEIVVVRAASRLKLMRDLRLVYSGRHRDLDSCAFLSGSRVTVTPLGDRARNAALVELDGEQPGRIPASFEMLEGALELRG